MSERMLENTPTNLTSCDSEMETAVQLLTIQVVQENPEKNEAAISTHLA